MYCPYCHNTETKVTDKRDVGKLTRRRRECLKCKKRFSTHELVEFSELKVLKKNGKRELFSKEKVRNGIIKSCEKRPVTKEKIEKMTEIVEKRARLKKGHVDTTYIGELISKELKKTDKIAYIRFASVYREFADLSDFKKEIRSLINGRR